jgi:hypothetical protein
VFLDSPLELLRFRVSDESFASRIGDGLPDQVDALAGLEEVRNRFADACEWNTLVERDVLRPEVPTMHYDAFGLLAPQASGLRDRDMNRTGVGV